MRQVTAPTGSARLTLAAIAFGAGGTSAALELSVYGALTTDYVWRGVTQSDGDPAAQLGLDLHRDGGLYGGVWASTIDIAPLPGHARDLEVQYYLGYLHELGPDLSVGAAVIAYTYPGMEGGFDYDYSEYTLSLNVGDRYWVEYAFSADLFGSGAETHNVELIGEWPLTATWDLSAGAGYYEVSKLSGDDYLYWDAGVTGAFDPFSLDLRYHDADDWVPFVSAADRSGSRLVLSLQFAF